jgi:tetratricopeptide (TPR) repeat protein
MDVSKVKTRLRPPAAALQLVRQGDALRKSGDFPHAEEAYRKATGIDPRCADAWAELGCLMMDCRRFPESVTCFQRILRQAAEIEADDPPQAAIKLLLEVASRKPEWARGQFSLGCAYEHLGDPARAREHLSQALQLDPTGRQPFRPCSRA